MNDSADILIVEDNAESRRVLETMLKKHGYKVRTADSGKTALRECAAQIPDIILLDIRMPEMDGYEVCMTLKQQDATRDIPVIFISALDDTLDKVQGFLSGGVDYITKPFHAEEISVRVATHLALIRKSRMLEASLAIVDAFLREAAAEGLPKTEAQRKQLAEATKATRGMIEMLKGPSDRNHPAADKA